MAKLNEMEFSALKLIGGWDTVDRFESGPRLEITLFIRRYSSQANTQHDHKPRGYNREEQTYELVPVRFGGVENLEEVKAFFERVAASRNSKENLLVFNYDASQKSQPGKILFKVVFDRTNETVVIRCKNISEGEPFWETR